MSKLTLVMILIIHLGLIACTARDFFKKTPLVNPFNHYNYELVKAGCGE